MREQVERIIKKEGIPKLYSLDGKPGEEVPIKLKFIDIFGTWEWYAWEADIEDDDIIFFGYVNGFEKEMGYFYLSEFQSVNQGIQRIVIDKDFIPITLAELKDRWNIGW